MLNNISNNSLERRKTNDLHKTKNLGTKYCADGRLQSQQTSEWETL